MTDDVRTLIDDAAFDFATGESASALEKLQRATTLAPETAEAWHALSEIHFHEHRHDDALAAAEKAHELEPDDVFINTSLSRIWMQKGDKTRAEHFGARARVLGWKDQLREG